MRGTMMTRALLVMIPILIVTTPSDVQAVQPPATYYAKAEGNSVTICNKMLNTRTCPQPEGMLRQNVATGRVVRLGQHCTERRVKAPNVITEGSTGACYLDECVPPGTYRYGLARPLKCMGSASYYYYEVKVTRALPEACTRGGPAPTAVKRTPWSDSPYVCTRGCFGCGVAAPAEPPLPLLLLAAGFMGLLVVLRRL